VHQLSKEQSKNNFFKQVVNQTLSINNEINRTLKSIKVINGRTRMLSITAKIEANRTGDIGKNFLVVSNSIDELSTKTDNAIDKMKKETIQEIETISKIIENKSTSIQGNRLVNLALTNIRIVDRNLFERSADIRWWATDDILINSLVTDNYDGYSIAHNRLARILKSYSVYRELILCDVNGTCMATATDKFGFSGQNFSDKLWFKSAMNTKNGTQYGFQSVTSSYDVDDHFSIIYSCKIHEGGNPENKIIGVLGAVFKWTDFAQRIINETSLSDEEKMHTRVLLCDDLGKVLADTYEKILDETLNFHGQKELFKKKKGFIVTKLNERNQLICHASSSGFQGCLSENWHSLIIQDIDIDCFNHDLSEDESLDTVIGFISNLSEKTQNTINEINKINDETQMLSINAAIESTRIGDSGRGFGVISGFMGDLSRKTAEITTLMEFNTQKKITELNSFILSNSRKIQGERLVSLSFTNIDLIDRTLYERTADVRWWATENSIVDSLIHQTNQTRDLLTKRLETLLRYYTVYDDLIVCDLTGNVITNGLQSKNLSGINMENTLWFQNALKLRNEDYGFDIIPEQEGQEINRIVFYSKVYGNNVQSTVPMGILGIVFKWKQFIDCIFNETPLNEDELDFTSLLILDAEGNKLAKNNKLTDIHYKNIFEFLQEKKNYETISIFNSAVVLGHAQSVGYEKFSTGWHSLILQSKK